MWEKLYSSVVSVLDFNQATLSGCVDIICVRHKEVISSGGADSTSGVSRQHGSSELRDNERWIYRSTPFHVRFGKTKLLKSREKTVSIYVNGELSSLTMKLGAAGEAFFDEDGRENVDLKSLYSHQLSDASGYSEEEDVGENLMDYGYYACSNSRCSVRSDNNELSMANVSQNNQPGVDAANHVDGRTRNYSDRISAPEHQSGRSALGSDSTKSNLVLFGAPSTCRSRSDLDRDWNDMSMSQDYDSGYSDDQILQFSLCGHLLSSQDEALNHQLFAANIVDWERLNTDPSLWYHSSLVARFDNRPPYYPSRIALPLLASWIVFKKPLSGDAIATLLRTTLVATSTTPTAPLRISASEFRNSPSGTRIMGSHGFRRYKVSIRPTSDQLAALNLKMGVNRITFTVNSSWQGTKSVHARLYLWPSDSRIVISDVDGTITKSDALGHIMPILGRDWSHTGVAELFTKIRSNGYHVVYLTARAIGQADYTREYLFGLTQKKKAKLPLGPLFLSPDRLLPSFKREVISRSTYMFKIPALRDIRNLFPPEHNPFYAGFGNNESDHRAYVSVGVPENRVFIINPSGIIRHVNATDASTYESMSDISELMFPPCHRSANTGTDDDRR
ncbi:Phosphatidate phosphatase PAH2 [Babesia sp. Xinjiang]|uniref:Phosphatidate phosphatase PAH2 n=1 Tax=Babesia sp. Xinjiang TaxID=462227 RepID=UPI000A223BC4|nr:Phosphatidate phosphatase PAH2 [Babesia sp. Xinjiang]ORM41538.1 Phosphatidate phosphatase PAH2 [Babesia sp. Xinjiang]